MENNDEFNWQGCAAVLGSIAAIISAIALFVPKDSDDDPEKNKIEHPVCETIGGLINGAAVESNIYMGADREEASQIYHEVVRKTDECLPSWGREGQQELKNESISIFYTEFVRGENTISVEWSYSASSETYSVDLSLQ